MCPTDQLSFDFEDGAHNWPPNSEYPLNIRANDRRTVEEEVIRDIESSENYLVITGFTSLSKLIEVFGERTFEQLKTARVVLGWEPMIRGRKTYQPVSLEKSIKDYWLSQDYSIIHGGAVITLIEKIKKDEIKFRFRDKLHAKIFVGDHHAILGSANFSHSGMNTQLEANVRVENSPDDSSQYEAFRQIAENYFEIASDFKEQILFILEKLIRKVTWQEALARAIAEVLEGQWIEGYEELKEKMNFRRLWPIQRKGIAQALHILQERNNVLIADPTGSGKTKMCSAVILTLLNWLWKQGRQDKANPLVICPPLVIPNWQKEFENLMTLQENQLSMGLLSNAKNRNKQRVARCLKLANIIAVDEAHNYLNPDSKRSLSLRQAGADYFILATATPINKKVDDLLRVVEMLDVDNLSPEDFEFYRQLRERPKREDANVGKTDLEKLAGFISQFTVRRTKAEINRDIKKNPSKYSRPNGGHYKFPYQHCLTYDTKETEEDRLIAAEITVLAKTLHGLNYLRNIQQPEYGWKDDTDLKRYIKLRLTAAKALTGYMIRAALRSSHVALVEHIEGAKAAMEHFDFKTSKSKTGNMLSKLERFHEKSPRYGVPKELLPSWLTNEPEYNAVVTADIKTYKKITALAKKLSGQRELGKVHKLMEIQESHRLLLAFDSTIITLDYLAALFQTEQSKSKVFVVSGSKDAVTANVLELFGPGSEERNCIALCSDKMSEGVNLQGASSVMLLDMPSVLRIAEQRIGRIERMDSAYPEIYAYWPNDSEEFSLKGDKKLFDIAEVAEKVYGSNLKLPADLKRRLAKEGHFKNTDSTESIIGEYRKASEASSDWEGINNSFQPLVELKEGRKALVPQKVYNQFRNVKATVRTGVSFIHSSRKWCFIATRGSEEKSPRWIFIDDQGTFLSEFPTVCEELRKHLTDSAKESEWNQNLLEEFVRLMQQHERELLPWKRRRALQVAEYVLEKKLTVERKTKGKDRNLKRIRLLQDALKIFKPLTGEDVVDYHFLAQTWIELFQPLLDAKREENKRKRKVFNLDSLKRDWRTIELSEKFLSEFANNFPRTQKIDQLIAACIIGVPKSSN